MKFWVWLGWWLWTIQRRGSNLRRGPATEGSIRINGEETIISSPADAMRAGMALLTEDRKETGCFLPLTILENMQIAALQYGHSQMGYVDESGLRILCDEMKNAMRHQDSEP